MMAIVSPMVVSGYALRGPPTGAKTANAPMQSRTACAASGSTRSGADTRAATGSGALCAGGVATVLGTILASRHKRSRQACAHVRHNNAPGRNGNGNTDERPGVPPESFRSDLFLQLPLNNGVLLSGFLANASPSPRRDRMLPPPAALPPLSIVPVAEGGNMPAPFKPDSQEALMNSLAPGPLRPTTSTGRALRRVLQVSPEHFAQYHDYELCRIALGGRQDADEAEALLLSAYARLMKFGNAPGRPSVNEPEQFDKYAQVFSRAAMTALESTTSQDFQLIAKAHVLGLVQGTSFPSVPAKDARELYGNAMRFGFALMRAEVRFLADGAAGTFVPLPLETQLQREELEAMWKRPPRQGSDQPGARTSTEKDAEAAQRSLSEALLRLRRIGEARPGLATYLGWLGRFDAEALSLLATPSPMVAMAMKLQVESVWGESSGTEKVATTPSDLVEAVLFGAWLQEGATAAECALLRHRRHDPDADDLDVP